MRRKSIAKKGAILLAGLLMINSLAGCGKQKEQEQPQAATSYTEEEFDEAVENGEFDEVFEEDAEDADESDTASVTEVMAEDCFVSFLEPKTEGPDFSVTAALENHSKDVTYMVAIDPVYANGYNCGLSVAEQLKPGESKKTEILLDREILGQLEKGGCAEVRTLDLYTRVFDAENYLSEPVYNEHITIHPYEDDYHPLYERGVLDTDTIFMDSEDADVILTEAAMDANGDYIWKLFLKNKTGSGILYSLEDVTINGISVDPCWSMPVKGEGCSYAEVLWTKELLEDSGITDVEEVIFSLVLYDDDNSDSEWRVCENITYKP